MQGIAFAQATVLAWILNELKALGRCLLEEHDRWEPLLRSVIAVLPSSSRECVLGVVGLQRCKSAGLAPVQHCTMLASD